MRRFAFAALLFAFACQTIAQQPAEPKPKTDLDLIQGVWDIVGLESGGKQQPEKNYRGNTFTFDRAKAGDKMVDKAMLREIGHAPVEFTFSLDPAKTPKAIDLTAKGTPVRGIYKLDGDDLTLCISLGGPRPTEFATKVGGDTETFTLKRSTWERYSDKAFGFVVDFPGKPTESKRDETLPGGAKVTTTIYTVRSEMERVSYLVSVTPLPARLDAKEADAALDAAQKAMLAEVEKAAKVKVEPEPKYKTPGYATAGRELTILMEIPDSKEKVAMRARLFVAGDRLYGLVVTGVEEGTRSPNVGRFWGSFRPSPPEGKKKDPPGKE